MITGVLFLIVSVALHILIPSQIRTYETSAVTAATVPTLLIRGMILCSVILLVQGILSKEKTEYTISGAIFTKENLLRLKPVIYIAMLIAYALLLPHIGFIISSLLLANGILLYFGTRKWWFYAIASAAAPKVAIEPTVKVAARNMAACLRREIDICVTLLKVR